MHYDDWIIFLEEDLTGKEVLEGEIYDIKRPYEEGVIELGIGDVSEPVMEWEHDSGEELGYFSVEASPTVRGLRVGDAIGWRASSYSDVPSVNKIHFVRAEEPEGLQTIESYEDLDVFNEKFLRQDSDFPNKLTYEQLVMFRYFSDDLMEQYRSEP